MEADEHREVGHVRPEPDDLHEEPVDDDGDRRPVLVVRREPGLHIEQRPGLDEGPLVAEEGQHRHDEVCGEDQVDQRPTEQDLHDPNRQPQHH